jgi:hypothetical protein
MLNDIIRDWVRFLLCIIAAWVFMRGVCVIVNNACCRILEWERKDKEKEARSARKTPTPSDLE